MSATNEYRDGPNGGITREFFRGLIDPLLNGLGVKAEHVARCSFDADGFELVLFHTHDDGRRVMSRPLILPNAEGGTTGYNGLPKVTLRIPIEHRSSSEGVH